MDNNSFILLNTISNPLWENNISDELKHHIWEQLRKCRNFQDSEVKESIASDSEIVSLDTQDTQGDSNNNACPSYSNNLFSEFQQGADYSDIPCNKYEYVDTWHSPKGKQDLYTSSDPLSNACYHRSIGNVNYNCFDGTEDYMNSAYTPPVINKSDSSLQSMNNPEIPLFPGSSDECFVDNPFHLDDGYQAVPFRFATEADIPTDGSSAVSESADRNIFLEIADDVSDMVEAYSLRHRTQLLKISNDAKEMMLNSFLKDAVGKTSNHDQSTTLIPIVLSDKHINYYCVVDKTLRENIRRIWVRDAHNQASQSELNITTVPMEIFCKNTNKSLTKVLNVSSWMPDSPLDVNEKIGSPSQWLQPHDLQFLLNIISSQPRTCDKIQQENSNSFLGDLDLSECKDEEIEAPRKRLSYGGDLYDMLNTNNNNSYESDPKTNYCFNDNGEFLENWNDNPDEQLCEFFTQDDGQSTHLENNTSKLNGQAHSEHYESTTEVPKILYSHSVHSITNSVTEKEEKQKSNAFWDRILADDFDIETVIPKSQSSRLFSNFQNNDDIFKWPTENQALLLENKIGDNKNQTKFDARQAQIDEMPPGARGDFVLKYRQTPGKIYEGLVASRNEEKEQGNVTEVNGARNNTEYLKIEDNNNNHREPKSKENAIVFHDGLCNAKLSHKAKNVPGWILGNDNTTTGEESCTEAEKIRKEFQEQVKLKAVKEQKATEPIKIVNPKTKEVVDLNKLQINSKQNTKRNKSALDSEQIRSLWGDEAQNEDCGGASYNDMLQQLSSLWLNQNTSTNNDVKEKHDGIKSHIQRQCEAIMHSYKAKTGKAVEMEKLSSEKTQDDNYESIFYRGIKSLKASTPKVPESEDDFAEYTDHYDYQIPIGFEEPVPDIKKCTEVEEYLMKATSHHSADKHTGDCEPEVLEKVETALQRLQIDTSVPPPNFGKDMKKTEESKQVIPVSNIKPKLPVYGGTVYFYPHHRATQPGIQKFITAPVLATKAMQGFVPYSQASQLTYGVYPNIYKPQTGRYNGLHGQQTPQVMPTLYMPVTTHMQPTFVPIYQTFMAYQPTLFFSQQASSYRYQPTMPRANYWYALPHK